MHDWNRQLNKPPDRLSGRPRSYLELVALAEKNGLFSQDKRGEFLRKVFSRKRYSAHRDPGLEKELQELVEAEELARARRGNLPRFEDDGNLDLGNDLFESRILRTDIKNLLRSNTLIVGGAGIGKSTGLRHLSPQVARVGVNQIVFDCKKSGLRDLKQVYEKQGRELCLVSKNDGCLNVFEPEEGVHPRDYITPLADALGSALEQSTPAIRSYEEVIYQLYAERGVFSQSPANFPHLGDFRETVASSRKIHSLIKQSTLARLDPILLRSSKIFCYRYGWTMKQISQTNTLWELWEKSEPEQSLIAHVCLMKEFTRRVANRLPGNETDYWAVFDDAQMILTEHSFIKDAIKVMRETGITLCMCVQSIADCDPAVIANSGSRFVGRCSHFPDLRDMCQSMGLLTYEEIANVRPYLTTGVFLTQLAGGFSDPFLLKFPARPRSVELTK